VRPGRRAGRRTATALVAVSLAIGVAQSARLSAQRWRPSERALVSDFSVVTAVAASPYTVYGATLRGLIVYDRAARRWRPPVTSLDGYPQARVWTALADPVNDAVWLGTDQGWARYDPNLRMWESGVVVGGVRELMLDADDLASGVFLRGGTGWEFLPRGAITPLPGRPLPPPGRRITALTPEEALRRAPSADAMRALVLTDARLRAHQFTAAAATPDASDLFFGTTGMGMVRVDGLTGEWEALAYGLPAPAAGGLAPGPGGVWVAALARPGERAGLAWVSADLSAVRVSERPGALGPPFQQGRRLLGRGRFLWVATESGVVRVDARSFETRAYRADRALPDDDVRSLAPAPDGVWIGTRRGLARISEDGTVSRVGTFAEPVLALAVMGDSLWVGSSAGLGVLAPDRDVPVVPPAVAAVPTLRGPVVALARSADTLIAATPDQVAWRDPATGDWTVTRPLADLGVITALAGDEAGAWVGGAAGIAFWDIGHGTFHSLRVPLDLPAGVRDVMVDPPWLWVATDSGLVRFSRGAARTQ